MAGTLFGLGLSQQFDVNGDPLSGCKLYLYQANTSTPVTAYMDINLTAGQEHPHPIVGDSTGRIPAFWLADGSYRAQLKSNDDIVQFDEPEITAIGPAPTVTPPTVDQETIATTGDVKWRPGEEILSGWVRMNGTTIGNATSGATFAHADAADLFEWIWNNFSDTLCPVSNPPGRGGSGSADFGAGKRIQLLDLRGRSPFGLDDMGASASGRLNAFVVYSAGNATTGGSSGGEVSHILGIAEMPSHNHGGNTNPAGAHEHFVFSSGTQNLGELAGASRYPQYSRTPAGDDDYHIVYSTTPASDFGITSAHAAHQHEIPSQGSATPHQTMCPFVLGTWYWKL